MTPLSFLSAAALIVPREKRRTMALYGWSADASTRCSCTSISMYTSSLAIRPRSRASATARYIFNLCGAAFCSLNENPPFYEEIFRILAEICLEIWNDTVIPNEPEVF